MPQTPQSSVATPYTGVQASGDLNVVIVGWNDASVQIESVADSAGNSYQLGTGPTSGKVVAQSIYYAKNIKSAAAHANVVTVTFASPAAGPDIRILEYSGLDTINPLDAVTGQAGCSIPGG